MEMESKQNKPALHVRAFVVHDHSIHAQLVSMDDTRMLFDSQSRRLQVQLRMEFQTNKHHQPARPPAAAPNGPPTQPPIIVPAAAHIVCKHVQIIEAISIITLTCLQIPLIDCCNSGAFSNISTIL
jgi:hypothetical protein